MSTKHLLDRFRGQVKVEVLRDLENETKSKYQLEIYKPTYLCITHGQILSLLRPNNLFGDKVKVDDVRSLDDVRDLI